MNCIICEKEILGDLSSNICYDCRVAETDNYRELELDYNRYLEKTYLEYLDSLKDCEE